MFDSFFLAVLALLAFPVMAIVALIRANEARGLLWRLNLRVAALESGLAPAAALPAQPPAEPAPASPHSGRARGASASGSAANAAAASVSPALTSTICGNAAARAGRFRGTGRHPLGRLDRRRGARARRHISGALLRSSKASSAPASG